MHPRHTAIRTPCLYVDVDYSRRPHSQRLSAPATACNLPHDIAHQHAHLTRSQRCSKAGVQLLAPLARAARCGVRCGRRSTCVGGIGGQTLFSLMEEGFDALHLLLHPLQSGILVLRHLEQHQQGNDRCCRWQIKGGQGNWCDNVHFEPDSM